MYRQIYFKELAHVIIEAGISKICRVGWQSRDTGRADAKVQVKGGLLAEFSLDGVR